MKFSQQLYPYQEEILSVFEREKSRGEKKIHIVAPPGSGKTIIGLEIVTRLNFPTLILVPNLTLQEQWKDKIEKLFLEEYESSQDLISTNISEVKKINIITYQSLSGTDNEDDEIHAKILDLWYESEKSEFSEKSSFLLFAGELREMNPVEYRELYGKHRKKLKGSGESEYTRKLMKGTIHDYIARLRTHGIATMIVDEAHHLTSWWSHVLYEIWNDLEKPYIIGLTATPPFESVDYFELDESYTKLLGTVDYYIPTPAIVKSGRLAPYSDLLYIVTPDENLSKILDEKERLLREFLEIHKNEITLFLHTFLTENFERMKVKSLDLLEKWMRFVYVHKDSTIDMSSYITANARLPLSLEDIAKSVGKWTSDGFKKSKNTEFLDTVKSLFFDLGYIWRGSSLYRFETPIEKGLIYSKSKIQAVEKILDQELKNLGENLRVAIITDFLDVESDWINGHFIFDEVAKNYSKLNPYLVSGQGIWKIEKGQKILTDETILSVTEKLTRGETKIVIGTRGILGEGWDCPRVNTLIDLTGVSAYMSVNQVHGRAIRLDPDHPEKVANIYDIVCLGTGYPGMRDFERLEKKHTQFYGVDDAGLIIKELDHIYPQLEKVIHDTERINTYTLRKSTLRSMVKELWNIGGEYKNEEVFSLSLNIQKPYEFMVLSSRVSIGEMIQMRYGKWKSDNILLFGESEYHKNFRFWLQDIIDSTVRLIQDGGYLGKDFGYTIHSSHDGSIKITAKNTDMLVGKKFIEVLGDIFSPITSEKYKVVCSNDMQYLSKGLRSKSIEWLGIITYSVVIGPICIYLGIDMGMSYIINTYIICTILLFILILIQYKKFDKKVSQFQKELSEIPTIVLGIPIILGSNEEKRMKFLGILSDKGIRIAWFNWIRKYNGRSIIILSVIIGFIFEYITHFEIQLFLSLLFSLFLGSILYGIIFLIGNTQFNIQSLLHTIKQKKYRKVYGDIALIESTDVGSQKFISAKIEKLWI